MTKQTKTHQTWRVWLSAYAPVLLWIAVIFYLSSDNGSSAQTSRFVRPLLEFLFPNSPEATIELYHRGIRKAAHVFEYSALSLLVARSFLIMLPAFRYWALASIGVVGVTALIDELNQSLEASRTASGYDSLLDIVGGAVAVTILWFVLKRRTTRPLERRE